MTRTTMSDVRAAFPQGQMVGKNWLTRCILPGHEDKNPSLSITIDHGKLLVVCTCNRSAELFKAVAERLNGGAPHEEKKAKPSEIADWKGITLAEYCELKKLHPQPLKAFFAVQELQRRGKPVLGWPYYDEVGNILATKIRLSASSHDTYFEPADPHVPFGLQNPILQNLERGSYDLIIAEGETDCLSFACWGYITIGISGANGWLPEYADLPIVENAKRVFVCQHQDVGGQQFVAKILKTLPQAYILKTPEGINDFNDLLAKYADVELDAFSRHPFIQCIDIAIQASTLERAIRKPKDARQKPAPMREEAFYGLAGKMVKLLEPVLETDRASILSNVLGCTAVLFQHHAYFKVTADKHYPVDFYLTVGNSAVSRKGTTTNAVLEIMERVRVGYKDHIVRGLSTGQGLISALTKKKKADEEGDADSLLEPIADAVLVEISEFAELLAVMRREENTLSAVLRDAWDGKPLHVTTRNQPLKAKNVSLATIAHVTRAELLDKLSSTDKANGFANRFLFIWTERTKLISRGDMGRLDYNEIVRELHEAVRAAEGLGQMERDEDAEEMWSEEYKTLTMRGETITDALLSRAEAHVVRLSLLYALLDKSPVIRKWHLKAALAVWDYCEQSVRYVFGDVFDPDLNRILRKLEDGPLTIGEIRRYVFGDNKSAERVQEMVLTLAEARKARRCTKEFKSKEKEAWALTEYMP